MPMDKRNYPKEWPQISAAIRERARQRCERCGVQNGAIGWRDDDANRTFHPEPIGDTASAACQEAGVKLIRIVLTVAHLNHDTMDSDPGNLQALCQLCHNRLDAPLRAIHAAETRRRKRIAHGQLVLVHPADCGVQEGEVSDVGAAIGLASAAQAG
jgi:hypothetical protein